MAGISIDHVLLPAMALAALAILWLATPSLLSSRQRRTERRRPVVMDYQPPTRPAPQPPALNPAPAPANSTSPQKRPPPPFSGRAYVIDGDTIRVNKRKIRLFGMDAPEMDQCGGGKAKSNLIRLTKGRKVHVEPLCFDVYDRIVAKVWIGENDLSERMVRGGYAVATGRWNRDYLPAEREARNARRGLWAACPDTGITDPSAHRKATRCKPCGPPPDDSPPAPPRRPWLR